MCCRLVYHALLQCERSNKGQSHRWEEQALGFTSPGDDACTQSAAGHACRCPCRHSCCLFDKFVSGDFVRKILHVVEVREPTNGLDLCSTAEHLMRLEQFV